MKKLIQKLLPITIKVPNELFTIKHKFERKDFAPGIWAGTEGLKLTITKVDLDNGIITLEYQ